MKVFIALLITVIIGYFIGGERIDAIDKAIVEGSPPTIVVFCLFAILIGIILVFTENRLGRDR